ncbi:hypothetical protein ACNQGB_16465 [Flavobacterium sp. XS1P32]|uniref:hypothetical protein n=1 Tax=Flavobacterium sp. XS1P32 TaxID=3401726 RepID=UPI003AAFD43D
MSRKSCELNNSSLKFYSSLAEYYDTKLATLKIQMIAEATKDASARAKSIAENADANLGSLKKSDMDVFKLQVKTPLKTFLWWFVQYQ